MIIAIGNIGSTSLKTRILDLGDAGQARTLGEANLDRIKTPGASTFACRVGEGPRQKETLDIMGFSAGIRHVLDWYVKSGVIRRPADIQAMGFKCVMGITNGANNLTPAILDEMRKFQFVAPVHNGPYLEAIGEFRKVLDVPMVGVFEPSFHWSLPAWKRYMGLPWEWHQLGIRKLGFHGASHRYLAAAAYQALGSERGRIITVHLGGSSSLCAIQDGRSVDISTSFSPNSGVLQGTRTGDVDATAVLYAMKELHLSVDEAQEAISNSAGLKGMAGIGTEDLRAIMEAADAGNERARMTIELYVDGVRKCMAGYAAVMGGVDCLVFGGGIGENSPRMRRLCAGRMEFMGVRLDLAANESCVGTQGVISADGSPVRACVIPTNEEIVVAWFTKRVVEEKRDLVAEEMVLGEWPIARLP